MTEEQVLDAEKKDVPETATPPQQAAAEAAEAPEPTELPEKILWVQGVAEGDEHVAAFSCLGSLVLDAPLYSDVFVSGKGVQLPPIEAEPHEFKAMLAHLKAKVPPTDTERMLKIRSFLQERPQALFKETPEEEAFRARLSEELEKRLSEVMPGSRPTTQILLLDHEAYSALREKAAKMAKEEGEADERESELEIVVKVQMAVDAAKGKSVEQLSQGEKVLVRVIDERPLAQFLGNLLAPDGDQPIPAEAFGAEELPTGSVRLLVKLGPGLLGECVLPRNVLIKVVPPETQVEPEVPTLFGFPFTLTPFMAGNLVLLVLFVAFFVLARILASY